MTTVLRALAQLVSWPDLTEAEPSCRTGRALRSGGAEIVHFHFDRRVDLHLTARMIQHFEGDLKESTAVLLVPGSQWVTIRLECDADVDLLMTLVSVALQAHEGRPDVDGASSVPCNDHGGAVLARENAGG